MRSQCAVQSKLSLNSSSLKKDLFSYQNTTYVIKTIGFDLKPDIVDDVPVIMHY